MQSNDISKQSAGQLDNFDDSDRKKFFNGSNEIMNDSIRQNRNINEIDQDQIDSSKNGFLPVDG